MTQLRTFTNIHSGQTLLVCGCGVSLNDFHNPQDFITIGVNDVGRKFDPDYLVVVNPRSQFSGDRFQHVENSKARYLFTQLDLGAVRPQVIRFQLGRYGGTDFSDANSLHYTQNSPYVAICLAVHMGAKRIGLIGVDFTEDHFFGATGAHPLTASLEKIDREYAALQDACQRQGIELFNLSSHSRLSSLPKLSLQTFASNQAKPKADALRIVSYATTPVAGVPAILARCIQAQTPHQARCVWACKGYGNGVEFAGDIEWSARPAEADAALAEADVVIVHNGKVDDRHRALFKGKAVLTMAHNYLWNVDTGFINQGFPGVVVGQYQATLPEFAGWRVVPNPMPLWEPAFQPASKGERITIAYTPSGKHERYPQDHRLYWHGKGYETTMRALERLADRYSIRIEAVREQPLSHSESLQAKRNAHIVIDECVTGSYHRNSLEGLALGCVVVNGVGLLPGMDEVLRQCAGGGEAPFVRADTDNLEQTLSALIESGPAALSAAGLGNRQWLERHWDFARQWQQFWQPAIEQALGVSRPAKQARPALSPPASAPAATQPSGLSAIIPQGGADRLPLLAATIANLVQCPEVDQIIVVELGAQPLARRLCGRLDVDYVFGYAEGAFNKAHAINIGCGLTRHDLLLWSDNDLLFPVGSLAEAIREMRNNRWDMMFPYGRVAYLSEMDSLAVREGGRHPTECRPVNVYAALQAAIGGVLLVRNDFVQRHGGMCEEFLGWGGEDNAWVHKVQVLGRYGVTEQRQRTAYHLYHADSNGAGGAPGRLNPHYAQNVALMQRIKSLQSPQAFLAQFPPPACVGLPWDKQREIAFVCRLGSKLATLADAWAASLQRLYGVTTRRVPAIEASRPEADAWVFFGEAVLDLPADSDIPAASRIAVLAHDALPQRLDTLQNWAWLLPESPDDIAILNQRHLPVWHRPWGATGLDGENPITLVQVLSLVLGRREPAPAQAGAEFARCVWMYWEGPCPEWIRLCQATVKAHAQDVRILDFESFQPLWTRDRDIDLRQLPIAQRADFVRAYLLAEYGGLWVDSDCIVMHALEPLLEELATCGFITHRERQGFFSNAFMGAQARSPVARALYQAICAALRSGRPLGWIALGNQPLTTILRSTDAPWRELDCEQVQPVCWSRPGVFFQTGAAAEHAGHLKPQAICYMLSNQNVQQHQARHPRQSLLQEDSFFRFLIDAAMQTPALNPVKSSGPDMRETLAFALEALTDIAPTRVLDWGGRYGFWAALLLEYGESGDSAPSLHIEAIAAKPAALGKRQQLYDAVSKAEHIEDKLRQAWHLIIIDRSKPAAPDPGMDRLLAAADYVLLISSLEAGGQSGVSWPVIRQALFQSRQDDEYGVFLLSHRDPKTLRQADSIETALHGLYRHHADQVIESIAGPGASMAQTQRVREQLPLLLQNLEVQSILELPCGDCNWLSRLNLGGIEYIGADPVAWAIDDCKTRHAGKGGSFLHVDPATGPLPKVDVILCRDFWVHLSFADIARVLASFRRSGSRYLLTTTFTGRAANVDVATGAWRPLNLEQAPFDFPPPIRVIDEKCTESQGSFSDKALGLWLLADV